MDDPALALILEESLALLSAGEAPEEIVSRFPDFADTLLPMLTLAAELREEAEDAIEDPLEFLQELGEQLKEQLMGDDEAQG